MKVLQEGNPNGWEIEQFCTGRGNGDGGCEARLLVAEDDIYVTVSSDYRGEDKHIITRLNVRVVEFKLIFLKRISF